MVVSSADSDPGVVSDEIVVVVSGTVVVLVVVVVVATVMIKELNKNYIITLNF